MGLCLAPTHAHGTGQCVGGWLLRVSAWLPESPLPNPVMKAGSIRSRLEAPCLS